jgi:FAD binding domain
MGREVLIAGAGVAGLTAAINLKKAGRVVRVLERDRVSGALRAPDWDGVENWTSLEDLPLFLERIGIEATRFKCTGSTSFSVIDPYGKRYDVHTEQPLFYLVKRGSTEGGLEHGLQNQAKDMGIPIEYGVSCPPGKADIWAGGTFGQGSFIVSTGITFKTDHPDWLCGIVDAHIAPRAYAYLMVVQGEGTLAVVLTEARKEANRLLERAIEIFKRNTDLNIREPRNSPYAARRTG